MFFLTYHEIAPRESGADFYTISAQTFAAHLELVKDRGLPQGSIDSLAAREAGTNDVFWSFDDGTSDHLDTVAPKLEEFSWRGIFFVPTEKIGRPKRLSREGVRQLAERGHEVGCHSHEHRSLVTQSEGEISDQFMRSLDILGEITGRRPRIFAPPGGYTSATVRRIAAEHGLQVLRTMKWGLSEPPRWDDLETVPLNHRITLNRLQRILSRRGLGWLRLVYSGKQIVKAFLPKALYERARGGISAR